MAKKTTSTIVERLTPSLPEKTEKLAALRRQGYDWIRDPNEPGFYLRLVSPPAWTGKYKERDPETDKVTYPLRKLGSCDVMTRDEARAELRRRRAVDGGYVPEADVTPIASNDAAPFTLADAWVERQAKNSKRVKGRPMAASTVRVIEGRLNRYCQAWLNTDINAIPHQAISRLASKVSRGQFVVNGRRYGTPRVAHDLLTDLSGIWKLTREFQNDPKLTRPNYFELVLQDYPAPDSTSHRPLTETETTALFSVTRDQVDDLATWLHFLFTRFQALTCSRPEGVARLLETDVNVETRVIKREGEKNGKRQVTGLCDAALDIIAEVRAIKLDPDLVPDYVAESPYLFPSMKTGDRFYAGSHPGEYVAAWLEKAGLVDLDKLVAEGYVYPDTTRDRKTGEDKPHPRAGEGKVFTPHDLRHNWASVADELDLNNRVISVFLGHAKKDVTDRYISKKLPALINAAETVAASLLNVTAGVAQ